MRLAIPFNVFQCVFQFDAVALQKGIDFHPSFVTRQLAKLDADGRRSWQLVARELS